MAIWKTENPAIEQDLTADFALIARWGALPPFGRGFWRLITESQNFIVPSGVTRMRMRAVGAGGGLRATSVSGSVSLTSYNGGDTAIGSFLLAGGGRGPADVSVGNPTKAGGLGGTTSTGELQAAGGNGGTFQNQGTTGASLGGGGAAGSQLGRGGDGGAHSSFGGGGGVGMAHGGSGRGGHPFIGNAGRLIGGGLSVLHMSLMSRFPGDHFAEVWAPPISPFGSDYGLEHAQGVLVRLPDGIGGYNSNNRNSPLEVLLNSYAPALNLYAGGSQVVANAENADTLVKPTPMGGHKRASGYNIGDATMLSQTNADIAKYAATFGGGGPSSGGGAWCCGEFSVTPGASIPITIGAADSTGGGGNGFAVMEW